MNYTCLDVSLIRPIHYPIFRTLTKCRHCQSLYKIIVVNRVINFHIFIFILILRYFVVQIIKIIYFSDYFIIHHYSATNMDFLLQRHCYIYEGVLESISRNTVLEPLTYIYK
jgi:hypothetical protein